MQIEEGIKLDFSDVLIRPKRSTLTSRSQVELKRQYRFLHAKKIWEGIPIIASNMDHVGTFAMANALQNHALLTAINKFESVENWQEALQNNPRLMENVFVTSGISDKDLEHLTQIMEVTKGDLICLDVANGYTQHFVEVLREVRKRFPEKIIMAGNVVTAEMTEELLVSGADIVKIGIGPGSVCLTRKKTGVGYPQLSAIIECANVAHSMGGLICGDGGCVVPGDLAKAFAAGADFVMLGGMLAGHQECSGEIYTENGQQYKQFYGMSSTEAMLKYSGKVAEYRASEGKCVKILYRGAVENDILDILGGLRSACTYVGAKRLKELSRCVTFIQVRRQLNNIFDEQELN